MSIDKILTITVNNITANGAKIIGDYLRTNKKLRYLDLTGRITS